MPPQTVLGQKKKGPHNGGGGDNGGGHHTSGGNGGCSFIATTPLLPPPHCWRRRHCVATTATLLPPLLPRCHRSSSRGGNSGLMGSRQLSCLKVQDFTCTTFGIRTGNLYHFLNFVHWFSCSSLFPFFSRCLFHNRILF